MPKILYVITGLTRSGTEKQFYYLIKNLPKNYKVKICTFVDGYYSRELKKENYDVIILRRNFGSIKNFLNILDKFNPDLVHSFLPHANIFCKTAKLFRNYKLICSMRGKEKTFKHFLLSILERLLDFQSNLILTNSYTFKKYLITCLGYKHNKIKVIYNSFIYEKIKNKTNLYKNKKIILVVANFRPGKDHITAVKTAKELLKYRNDFFFLFVGEGKEKQKIEKYVKKMNLASYVKFIGLRTDTPNILLQADVFFLPTLYESQSNAIIEAMFYKCPIVTTEIPENKEILENGREGLLVKIRDYKEMAKKINYLLENKKLREYLINNAYKKARKMFNLKKNTKKYLEIYEYVE